MACVSPRGHRWQEVTPHQGSMSVRDPAARVCTSCGAPGVVDKQGKVQVIGPPTSNVRVVPLAKRAKWAQQPTEHD